MPTYDAVEIKRPLPAWANDPNVPIPLGFVPKNGTDPDSFWLGDPGRRARILLAEDWRTEDGEAWVGVAAGAYNAICDVDCDRETAELIAKGWITAAGAMSSALTKWTGDLIAGDDAVRAMRSLYAPGTSTKQ
jgi:hypothetical protein